MQRQAGTLHVRTLGVTPRRDLEFCDFAGKVHRASVSAPPAGPRPRRWLPACGQTEPVLLTMPTTHATDPGC